MIFMNNKIRRENLWMEIEIAIVGISLILESSIVAASFECCRNRDIGRFGIMMIEAAIVLPVRIEILNIIIPH